MGSGKSTVGQVIADRLGWPLRDSDVEIEAATGRTVKALRDELGVDAMHELEARHLLEALAAPEPAVVAAGASTIDVPACRDALRGPGIVVVFLTASPAVEAARFRGDDHRGDDHRPWFGTDPEAFLAAQAAARYPHFRSVDPIELSTDDRTPDALADAALAAISARGLTLSGSGDQPAG